MHAMAMQREAVDAGGPVEIWLPDTIRSIGMYAFWHCDRLKTVRLPAYLEHLKTGLFGECSRLEPVSYTHLDVYKRQIVSRLCISGSRKH